MGCRLFHVRLLAGTLTSQVRGCSGPASRCPGPTLPFWGCPYEGPGFLDEGPASMPKQQPNGTPRQEAASADRPLSMLQRRLPPPRRSASGARGLSGAGDGRRIVAVARLRPSKRVKFAALVD
jgi:hypothetical protein